MFIKGTSKMHYMGVFSKPLQWIVYLSLLMAAYIGLGKFSLYFATMPEGIAIAWLPNGLLLALFLLRPYREWGLYAFVIVLSEVIADIPIFTLIQAIQFAFINLAETMLSALLLRYFSPEKHNFHNLRYFLLFIIIALTILPALSAIFGALVYHTQIESQTNFFAFWRIWLFGDALGILLMTPLLISWYDMKKEIILRLLSPEPVIMAPLTFLFAFFLFSDKVITSILPTTPMVFIIFMLWIIYRRGLIEGVAMSVLLSFIAIYFTVHHQGPFSMFSAVQNTLYLQEFIVAMVTIPLFFGVLLRQINEKTLQLEHLSQHLEEQVRDKTNALQIANQQLFELATTDSLTHIYNRRFLEETSEREISSSLRYGTDLSLIMFDIDFFKNINDTYGHHVGDDVLIALTQTVQSRIRQNDIFARIGGEEFVILMPNTTLNEAILLANELKETIVQLSIPVNDSTISFTVSFGIATLSEQCNSYQTLLNHADRLLYQAKESGRNCISWIDNSRSI